MSETSWLTTWTQSNSIYANSHTFIFIFISIYNFIFSFRFLINTSDADDGRSSAARTSKLVVDQLRGGGIEGTQRLRWSIMADYAALFDLDLIWIYYYNGASSGMCLSQFVCGFIIQKKKNALNYLSYLLLLTALFVFGVMASAGARAWKNKPNINPNFHVRL